MYNCDKCETEFLNKYVQFGSDQYIRAVSHPGPGPHRIPPVPGVQRAHHQWTSQFIYQENVSLTWLIYIWNKKKKIHMFFSLFVIPQVTGKFQGGVNPFTRGCCNNLEYLVCSPISPGLESSFNLIFSFSLTVWIVERSSGAWKLNVMRKCFKLAFFLMASKGPLH